MKLFDEGERYAVWKRIAQRKLNLEQLWRNERLLGVRDIDLQGELLVERLDTPAPLECAHAMAKFRELILHLDTLDIKTLDLVPYERVWAVGGDLQQLAGLVERCWLRMGKSIRQSPPTQIVWLPHTPEVQDYRARISQLEADLKALTSMPADMTVDPLDPDKGHVQLWVDLPVWTRIKQRYLV